MQPSKPARPPGRFRSPAARILAASIPLALLLLAVEVGVRVLTEKNSRWNVRLGAHKRFDEVSQFRVKANYAFPDGAVTNEQGFLAPRGLTFEKPAGRLRLIYLGDSVTFWPAAENYPAQVEGLLAQRTGLPVETLNTAVPGYATENARALFEGEVSRYDADVLLIYLGWNDLGQYGPEGLPYKRLAQGYEVGPLEGLLARSYSIRILHQLQRMRRRGLPTVNEPLTPEERALYDAYEPRHYEENLEAIVRLGKTRYPHVLIMTLNSITSAEPTPAELSRAHFPVGMNKNLRKLDLLVGKYNEVVRNVAEREEIGLVDLHALFDDPQARAELLDSCHVGAEGAGRIAQAVAGAVERALAPRIDSALSTRGDAPSD